jgi:hypothetical protein
LSGSPGAAAASSAGAASPLLAGADGAAGAVQAVTASATTTSNEKRTSNLRCMAFLPRNWLKIDCVELKTACVLLVSGFGTEKR